MKETDRESRTLSRMHKARAGQGGITLIEVIITLVLVGIISLFAGTAMTSAVRGFIQARDNAETAQKVHLAINRISRDLQMATNIVSGSSSAITFDTLLPSGVALRETLTLTGGTTLTLNGTTLLDDVTSFQISYIRYNAGGSEVAESSLSANSRGVEIQMKRGTGVNVLYTDRVFPRNTTQNYGIL